MATTMITQHARIGALLGVLLTVLAGSAIVLMHSNSHPATTPAVVVPSKPTSPTPVHVVRPVVNPLVPNPVHRQLEHYPRVVVGFFNPHSKVDQLTIAETRAGAAAMHIPFVSVSLLTDSAAGHLTALLQTGELLPNPGFLVYKRPGTVIYRSDGYLGRAGVEQALRDAR